MSLYAITVLQKSELKSPNTNRSIRTVSYTPENASKNNFSCPTASAALKNGRYWLALSLYFKSTLHRNVKGDSNRVQQMLSPHIGGNT